MKKPPSKADLRARLERETERFLQEGGEVERIPTGQSAREPGEEAIRFSRRLFTEPPAKRTLVPEVVATIEARRKAMFKRSPSPKRKRMPRPRRKMLYDDFGEPLRRVWVDE